MKVNPDTNITTNDNIDTFFLYIKYYFTCNLDDNFYPGLHDANILKLEVIKVYLNKGNLCQNHLF